MQLTKFKSEKTILLVYPLEPHKDGNGSQKRAAAHLTALLASSRVHLVVLDSRTSNGMESDPELVNRCESFSVIKYQWRPRQPIFSFPPFPTLTELWDPTFKRRLPPAEQVLQAFANVSGKHFDSVLCYKLLSATILDYAQSLTTINCARRILDFDDIQSLADQRAAAYENSGFEQSIIERMIRGQTRHAEDKYLATYDAVWVCSEVDRQELLSRKPRASIDAIPNGVPLADAPPLRNWAAGECVRLVFVGTLSYAPNQDGIVWFCQEVLPLIRAATQFRVELTIIGFSPPPEVLALAVLSDVCVAGGVESVAPYYLESDIVIAPIRFGGGTRIKILEAMSYRRPVVSTTIGAEGIDITVGTNALLGDSPKEFSDACVDLIESPSLALGIAQRGRQLVEEKYCNDVVANATNLAVFPGSSSDRL